MIIQFGKNGPLIPIPEKYVTIFTGSVKRNDKYWSFSMNKWKTVPRKTVGRRIDRKFSLLIRKKAA